MAFFVTLLCASQVYAVSCSHSSTAESCSIEFVTSVFFVIFALVILMAFIGLVCRTYRRKRLQQRAAQAHARSSTYSNQTPQASPPSPQNSTRLPPPEFPLLPSPPSTYLQISVDPSTFQTPSISVIPAAYIPPHATPVGHPSLPETWR
ncbi:hypothetical protein BDR04DRAFT_1156230 [Suillus decipiens]|nr:hypothetical protein BDR04DRAFT_1156230 [Suillus decipiens]